MNTGSENGEMVFRLLIGMALAFQIGFAQCFALFIAPNHHGLLRCLHIRGEQFVVAAVILPCGAEGFGTHRTDDGDKQQSQRGAASKKTLNAHGRRDFIGNVFHGIGFIGKGAGNEQGVAFVARIVFQYFVRNIHDNGVFGVLFGWVFADDWVEWIKTEVGRALMPDVFQFVAY